MNDASLSACTMHWRFESILGAINNEYECREASAFIDKLLVKAPNFGLSQI